MFLLLLEKYLEVQLIYNFLGTENKVEETEMVARKPVNRQLR